MKKAIKIIILSAVLIAIALGIIYVIMIAFADETSSVTQHTLEEYQLDIVGKIDSSVNIDGFSDLNDYSLNSEKMNPDGQKFGNMCELSGTYYKYYVENSFYSSDTETDDYYCYFCGGSPEKLSFGYYIEKDYRSAYWYIADEYKIPNVYDNKITEITIIDKVIDDTMIPRVKTSDAVRITDSETINKCKAQFEKTEYGFFDSQTMQYVRDADYDFLKNSFECNPSVEYLVLAKFDNSGIYQLLGIISESEPVISSDFIYPDLSKDFTWKNFLYFSMQHNFYEDDIKPIQTYADYHFVYYGFSGYFLSFKTSEGSSDLFDYTVYSNGNAVITRYFGNASEIVIPNKIDGHDVVGITASICDKNESADLKLKKVTVQEGIEFIGPDVFMNCYMLKDVKLPDSLQFIYKAAFYNCKSLKKINLPDNVQYVYSSAFGGCKKKLQVQIPEEITFL